MNPKLNRYHRQTILPNFGEEGQERLFNSSILVIGAGGLGCPVLLYLAAAGVGKLGIIDFDTVETSNLHRQVLYNGDDVGKYKAEVAAQKIGYSYPDTHVQVYNTRLENSNALDIIKGYDLVVDGSDNFATRYLVNDACVLLGKPLVYGSIFRFEGQVSVFNYKASPSQPASTNYRDLFPTPPPPDQVPNCAEAGVIGVLPGIIGSLQANEAIKIAAGIGEPLANRLLTFNALNNSFFEFELNADQAASQLAPPTSEAFKAFKYDFFCGMSPVSVEEIDQEEFERIAREKGTLIVDVRNYEEQPKMEEYPVYNLPLPELEARIGELKDTGKLLIFCQAGARSLTAAQRIKEIYAGKQVYSLKGGMNNWEKV
jgi:sulfur-carrier protein adenylyltransferase/sulfurtransferase